MARIKIEIPDNFIFSCSIPVRITDINYGNHLGNDSFISIVHEARMQWLAQHGFSEMKIEDQTGLIMADLGIEFKSESFYGDIIKIEMAVGAVTKISFEIYYRLSTIRSNKSILLAHAKTGMVCYNYERKKVAAVPLGLLELMKD